MRQRRGIAMLGLVAMLAGCGGGDGGGGTGATSGGTTGGGTIGGGTPTASGCTLRERQDWAAAQLREWYLFPETLPTSLDPASYTTVDDYIDALTANARAQRKDRYFTYLTSIKEENAYNSSGSTAGFGIRLSIDTGARRVLIAEAFEGAPALAAGIDRGTEILAIGTSASDLRDVSDLIAAGGSNAVNDALGPSNAGLARTLRISDAAGTRVATVTKADYDLVPVSTRYGAKVIDNAGQKVGYINLRTFITPADNALRNAFASFRAEGITNVIVDLRYNGGGLLSTAELFGDLLGGNRSTSDVFDYVTFRPEKAENNTTKTFAPQPQSVSPMKIAFIGTTGTASASELLINGFVPYLHANVALIGTNTYGKPVGQIALDREQCDDRLRVIALALQNAARQGAYYDGLAGVVEASCQAGDDLTHPLGDPAEASTAQALGFLAGKSCTAIPAAPASASASASNGAAAAASPSAAGTSGGMSRAMLAAKSRNARDPARALLMPDRPDTAQRNVPGLY